MSRVGQGDKRDLPVSTSVNEKAWQRHLLFLLTQVEKTIKTSLELMILNHKLSLHLRRMKSQHYGKSWSIFHLHTDSVSCAPSPLSTLLSPLA